MDFGRISGCPIASAVNDNEEGLYVESLVISVDVLTADPEVLNDGTNSAASGFSVL